MIDDGLLLLDGGMAARESGPAVVAPDNAIEVHHTSSVAVTTPECMVKHPVLSSIIGDNLCIVACADKKAVGSAAEDDVGIVVRQQRLAFSSHKLTEGFA